MSAENGLDRDYLMALTCLESGQLQEAEQHLRQALLSTREGERGEAHEAEAAFLLATVLAEQMRDAEAETFLATALELRIVAYGLDDIIIGQTYGFIGAFHADREQWPLAEAHLTFALETLEKHLDLATADYVSNATLMAAVQRQLGDVHKARETLVKGLDLAADSDLVTYEALRDMLLELADLDLMFNDLENRQKRLHHLMALAELRFDHEGLAVGDACIAVAEDHAMQGRFDEATRAYRRAAEIYGLHGSRELLRDQLKAWAEIDVLLGRYDEAMSILQQVHDIQVQGHETDHEDVGDNLREQGFAAMLAGRDTDAKRLFEAARLGLEKTQAPLLLAEVHHDEGLLALRNESFDEARREFEHALSLQSTHLSQDDPQLARAYLNLALASVADGSVAVARALLEEARDILQRPRSAEVPDEQLTDVLNCLADVYEIEGHSEMAKTCREQTSASLSAVVR